MDNCVPPEAMSLTVNVGAMLREDFFCRCCKLVDVYDYVTDEYCARLKHTNHYY